MKKPLFAAAALSSLLLLTGCATDTAMRQNSGPSVDVIAELKKSQNPLFERMLAPLSKEKPIIAASFANVDDLRLSSTFGRMASEVIASGLTDLGYSVVEVKMRDSLFIKQQAGEFMLSRQLKNLSREHNAQAVVLGTYAEGGDYLYVSARVVRTEDNIVIGSHDFSLPLNADIKHLLRR